MTFQLTIQICIYFQYAVFMIKLVVAHNSLRFIHLIGLSKRVNIQLIYMQINADIIKYSGLDLLKYTNMLLNLITPLSKQL